MNVLFFKIRSFALFYGRVIGNGSYLLNWVKSSVLKVFWYFYLFGVFLFWFGDFEFVYWCIPYTLNRAWHMIDLINLC